METLTFSQRVWSTRGVDGTETSTGVHRSLWTDIAHQARVRMLAATAENLSDLEARLLVKDRVVRVATSRIVRRIALA